MPDLIAALAFLAVNFAAASSGAVFKPGDWYDRLSKPGWVPPNWAFPLVWTALYLLNAAAGWLVWREAGFSAWPAFALYGFSLVLNAGWSYVFFGLRRMDLALLEATALWLSVAAVIAAFAPISAIAAILIAPYLVWVSVAIALNRSMIELNPDATNASAQRS